MTSFVSHKALAFICIMFCAVLFAGCQTMQKSSHFSTMTVDFAWSKTDKCSSKSPAFNVSNVPEGTKRLIFKMKDLNVPSYNHGGGTVEYSGDGHIPAGAFSYKGPCPPFGVHKYEFTVKAVDESGKTLLGEGKAVRNFPPTD